MADSAHVRRFRGGDGRRRGPVLVRPSRRRRPAGAAAARPPADLGHLAPRGSPAGRAGLHRDLPRSAGLRSLGRSPSPPRTTRPTPRRSVLDDLLHAMTALGHDRFAVVGHDRGSYSPCAWRWTTRSGSAGWRCWTAFRSASTWTAPTARFATAWWHWFFFAQPEMPERVINADPDAWYRGDPDSHGRGEPRRVPGRDPRSGGGARHAGGLPGRPDASTAAHERGRPGGRTPAPAARSSCCGRCATTSRTSTATPSPIWRDWADDVRGPRDRLGPPRGRGGARGAHPGARDVPGSGVRAGALTPSRLPQHFGRRGSGEDERRPSPWRATVGVLAGEPLLRRGGG